MKRSRHKQFNAAWTIDDIEKESSLFGMVRNTHEANPQHVISAYSDNAAVISGENGIFLTPEPIFGEWTASGELVHHIIKVNPHVKLYLASGRK